MMRILVVDDKKDNCRLSQILLKSIGYESECVSNGAEALEKLNSQAFDMIISDILMPVMDGFQLCKKCKEDPVLKKIPFVFHTATYTDQKDEQLALAMGAELFLRKPTEPEEFIKQIRTVPRSPAENKSNRIQPTEQDEKEVLKLYSERLIHKLEEKITQLEQLNVRLQQSESALKESEQRYRRLLEDIPIAFSIVQDGKIRFTNRFTEKLTGYTGEQLKEIDGFSLIHPEDQEKVRSYYKQRMQGGQPPDSYTIRLLTRDKQFRFVSRNVKTITWEEKPAVLVIDNDITELTRVQEDQHLLLKQSQQREAEITSLLAGSNAILGQQDFEKAARVIFSHCKNVTGAISGYVALLSKDGAENEVLFLDSGGLPCSVNPNLPMPVRGLREKAYRLGQTVFENDFKKSDWIQFIPSGHVSLENVLFAPLVIDKKSVGVIGLANKPGGFNEKDVRLVSAFSNMAAASLNNSIIWEELVKNEEKYRLVSQLTSDISYSCMEDINGTYILDWMSGAVEKITGYTIQEIESQLCWRFLVFPDDFQLFDTNVIGLKAGQKCLCELRLKRKDGELVWVACETECISDDNPSGSTRIYGGLRDITTRKRSDEILKKNEQQFHSLFDTMSQGVLYQDKDGIITGANRAAERILGFTVEEMKFNNSSGAYPGAIHEDGSPFADDEHPSKVALRTRKEVKDVVMGIYHPKDGFYHWILVCSVPFLDSENNKPYQVFTTFTDITQRLLQEAEIRHEHHILLNFSSQVPGMLYEFKKKTDGSYCVPFTNEAIKDCFGCTPADVKDSFAPIARVILEEDLPGVIDSIEKSARDLSSWECEYRVNLPGKGIRTLWGRAIPEKQADGSIIWYGFNYDVTERKEAQIKELQIETLAAANQAKSELLANVSHELRTPLTSIKGYIETLLEPDVNWTQQQQLEFLQMANRETDRLTFLIRDLLDMSRIDSGKMILDKRPYTINEILDSVSGVLSVITERHHLNLILKSDVPAILVDKIRIGQVITNLVENATKFSADGTPIVVQFQADGNCVIFSVEDKGEGMSRETRDNLFNRFFQAQRVVTGKTRGTGLGLAICKGIVEAHGGKIWAESEPGKGAIFSVQLPK